MRDLEPGHGGGGGGSDQSSVSGDISGVLAAAGANKFLLAAPVDGIDGEESEGNTIRSRDVTLPSSVKSKLNKNMYI